MRGHRDNATARAAGKPLSARPKSQGDHDGYSSESRKGPHPSRKGLRSEGGTRHREFREEEGGVRGGVDGDGGGDRRTGVTWRGKLQEEDRRGKGHEKKGPDLLSSGKKFEDLDNYLRGCAAAVGAKRDKRKRGRGLAGNSLGGNSGGGESSVETGGSSLSLDGEYEVCNIWDRTDWMKVGAFYFKRL